MDSVWPYVCCLLLLLGAIEAHNNRLGMPVNKAHPIQALIMVPFEHQNIGEFEVRNKYNVTKLNLEPVEHGSTADCIKCNTRSENNLNQSANLINKQSSMPRSSLFSITTEVTLREFFPAISISLSATRKSPIRTDHLLWRRRC